MERKKIGGVRRIESKRAVSEIVSYALMIVIAIGLAAGVYAWLRFQTRGVDTDSGICAENTALRVKDYTCNADASEISIDIENKGLFNVDGFFIKVSKKTGTLPTILLLRSDIQNAIIGRYDFSTPLKPNEMKTAKFSYSNILPSGIGRIQIQPFVLSEKKLGVCKNILSFDTDEEKECTAAGAADDGDGGDGDGECTKDCSCANSVCIGSTCSDGCSGTCSGTLSADCPSASEVACGQTITSENSCEGCTGTGTKCNTGYTCSSGTCICSESCASHDYTCGTYNFCGVSTSCGTLGGACASGKECFAGICTTCSESCASHDYTCGTYTFCGVSVNCGTCTSLGEGYLCSSGSCVRGIKTYGGFSDEFSGTTESWNENLIIGSIFKDAYGSYYQGEVIGLDPYMWRSVTGFDESYDHLEIRYKGNPTVGPRKLSIYYKDGTDCLSYSETCKDGQWSLINDNTFHILNFKIDDAEWIDNDGTITGLKLDFDEVPGLGTLYIDYIRFYKYVLP